MECVSDQCLFLFQLSSNGIIRFKLKRVEKIVTLSIVFKKSPTKCVWKSNLSSYKRSHHCILYSEGREPEYFLKTLVKKDILLNPQSIAASLTFFPSWINSEAFLQR